MKTNKKELSQILNRISQSGFTTTTFHSEMFNLTFIEVRKNNTLFKAAPVHEVKVWFSDYLKNGTAQPNPFVDECVDCGCQLVNKHPENLCGDCHNEFEKWYAEQCGFNNPEPVEQPYFKNAMVCFYFAIIIFILAVLIFPRGLPLVTAGLPGVLFFFGGVWNTIKHFIQPEDLFSEE